MENCKITKKVADNLILSEIYTYYCLATTANSEMISEIKQRELASLVGASESTIQRHLRKFEEYGLITKDVVNNSTFGSKQNIYKLNDEDCILMSKSLVQAPIISDLKGFLVFLKCRCLDDTDVCFLRIRELADTTKIGKSTVGRYLILAEENGYVTRDIEGMTILNYN